MDGFSGFLASEIEVRVDLFGFGRTSARRFDVQEDGFHVFGPESLFEDRNHLGSRDTTTTRAELAGHIDDADDILRGHDPEAHVGELNPKKDDHQNDRDAGHEDSLDPLPAMFRTALLQEVFEKPIAHLSLDLIDSGQRWVLKIGFGGDLVRHGVIPVRCR